MYLFAECGSDYEVVCKRMEYKFLRPCYGPAIYRVANAEDVKAKIDEGGEFNIQLELEITQQLTRTGNGASLSGGRRRHQVTQLPQPNIARTTARRPKSNRARC